MKNKEDLLQALEKSLGNVAMACRMANISRHTHYNWLENDEEYKKAYEEIVETQGDFVESKLFENIKNNDTTAIIFYCKTRLKQRGYTEKQEVAVNGDLNIQCNFNE